MGSNNNKSIIIEFNGLPGSGKTTIAKCLKEELEKERHKVYLNYYRSSFDNNYYSMLLHPSYWLIILKAYIYSNTFSYTKKIKRSFQLASFVRMYRIFVKDNDNAFLLSDQAIVQLFISLAHSKKLSDSPTFKSVLREIMLDTLPLVIVNCEINKDFSNFRIESRQKNGCRVESMTKQERLKTLDAQIVNFEFIRRELKEASPNTIQINVDTSLPVRQSIEMIKAVILTRIS